LLTYGEVDRLQEDKKIINTAVKGVGFTFAAQFISLVLSLSRSIILPKVLSVSDYGYWQIYVLYSTYVGLFALGFNDGIYLIYGKYQYNELPFKKLRMANRFYFVMLTIFTLLGTILSFVLCNGERRIAFMAVCIDILLMGINSLLLYILQITNQIKAYSFYVVLDKIILLCGIFAICFMPERYFYYVIFADVFSKLVVSIALIKCNMILIFGKSTNLSNGFIEFKKVVSVGLNLMIANLMGMIVTGIGRIMVDIWGDITEYAFYSFGITITNLILVFITAVSLVLYPTLKRLPKCNYGQYFNTLNDCVRFFNFTSLFAYFLMVLLIKFFLPKYLPILSYLNILFGVIVLQSKMQLVNNTFYKVLRKEKEMLKANMSCVLMFLIIVSLTYYSTRDVKGIAVATFISMLYRCYASEIFIGKRMKALNYKNILIEFTYILIFIFSTEFFSFSIAIVIQTFNFSLYAVLNFKKNRDFICSIVHKFLH